MMSNMVWALICMMSLHSRIAYRRSSMYLRVIIVLLFAVFISVPGTAFAASKDASNSKETLAKVLYASRNSDGNKYIFNKVEVIETGKNLGHGTPIKFRMKGIRGYTSQHQGSLSRMEAEAPFNDVFVVFYSKDEFGKIVACTEGGFNCVKEEDMKQHQALLDNMKKQHDIAKKQDAQGIAEYVQRQRDEEMQRAKQARLEQMRIQAQIPSVTLGTYKCYDDFSGVYKNRGEAVLTDVDISYVHVFPDGNPQRVKVIFEFSNINKMDYEGNSGVVFDLKREIGCVMATARSVLLSQTRPRGIGLMKIWLRPLWLGAINIQS